MHFLNLQQIAQQSSSLRDHKVDWRSCFLGFYQETENMYMYTEGYLMYTFMVTKSVNNQPNLVSTIAIQKFMCTYHSCLLHFLPPQRKFFRPLHWSANMKKNSACAVCSQHRLHHLQSAPSAVCTFCSLHCLHHLESAWSAPSAVYTVCSLHHLQSAWSAPSAVCTICSLHSLQSAWSALWCDRLGSGQATVVI